MVADSKRKEARKRKFAHLQKTRIVGEGNISLKTLDAGAPTPKKVRKTSDGAATALLDESVSVPEGTANSDAPGLDTQEAADIDSAPSAKTTRFLCFVGNLPFTASTGSIAQHFAKIQPRSIRHPTSKDTGKSKGFAFLEFDGYDRLKTCLSTFHHSIFDDGLSPARQINVELTAGGGGAKSKDRKAKLVEKNARLNEQRKRRAEEETRAGADGVRKGLEDVKKGGGSHSVARGSPEDQAAIHPSRRGRVSNR